MVKRSEENLNEGLSVILAFGVAYIFWREVFRSNFTKTTNRKLSDRSGSEFQLRDDSLSLGSYSVDDLKLS